MTHDRAIRRARVPGPRGRRGRVAQRSVPRHGAALPRRCHERGPARAGVGHRRAEDAEAGEPGVRGRPGADELRSGGPAGAFPVAFQSRRRVVPRRRLHDVVGLAVPDLVFPEGDAGAEGATRQRRQRADEADRGDDLRGQAPSVDRHRGHRAGGAVPRVLPVAAGRRVDDEPRQVVHRAGVNRDGRRQPRPRAVPGNPPADRNRGALRRAHGRHARRAGDASDPG